MHCYLYIMYVKYVNLCIYDDKSRKKNVCEGNTTMQLLEHTHSFYVQWN